MRLRAIPIPARVSRATPETSEPPPFRRGFLFGPLTFTAYAFGRAASPRIGGRVHPNTVRPP